MVGSAVELDAAHPRALTRCVVGLLLALVAASSFAVAVWDPWLPVLLIADSFIVVPLGVAVETRRRVMRGPDSTGRLPRTRVVVALAIMGGLTGLAIVTLAEAGLLLSFLTPPTMAGLLAFAWVRPSDNQAAPSFIVGALLFVFATWDIGQGDERPSVAIGATIAVGLAALAT
jgi:hypothetical protein